MTKLKNKKTLQMRWTFDEESHASANWKKRKPKKVDKHDANMP